MRILAALLIAIVPVLAPATVHTPATVPNVHLADSTRFTSNPDGILSDAAVATVDSVMRQIRHLTTAQGVVVVVDDTETVPADFATDLFEQWGLGQTDRDNGFLILVAKDRRRAEIRTGYGVEGLLPDIVCSRIVREQMAPHFVADDYDGGVVAAARAIGDILTAEGAAQEIQSRLADPDRLAAQDEDAKFFKAYLIWALMGAIAMLAVLLAKLYTIRRLGDHGKYLSLEKWKAPYLALSAFGWGVPLIAAIPLLIILWRLRNHPRKCPHCHTPMAKLDEATDNRYLDYGQDLEEQLGSVDYDVWLCPECGQTEIIPYVNHSSTYKPCPRCGVRALALEMDRVTVPPTGRREGQGQRVYRCRACGHDHYENYRIPRRNDEMAAAAAGAALGASLGRRGGGFGGGGFGGGGFGGGGFGGGHTGGGGGGGSW